MLLKAFSHYIGRTTLLLTSSCASRHRRLHEHTTEPRDSRMRTLFCCHSKCAIDVHDQSWKFDMSNYHDRNLTHESGAQLENLRTCWRHAFVAVSVVESCDRELCSVQRTGKLAQCWRHAFVAVPVVEWCDRELCSVQRTGKLAQCWRHAFVAVPVVESCDRESCSVQRTGKLAYMLTSRMCRSTSRGIVRPRVV